MKKNIIKNMTISSMLLAMAYVLPFLTGNLGSLGTMISPMHIPVMICGFVCGWKYGLVIGFIAPILRCYTLGAPMDFIAWPMAFELATYGLVTGLMYQYMPKKWYFLYVDLITAMVLGRMINLVCKLALLPLFGRSFVLIQVLTSLFIETWPAIIIQLLLIPTLIYALARAHFIKGFDKK